MCILIAKLLICFLLEVYLLLVTFSVQHKSCSCFLNFQGRVQMHHFLGSMSMYLHMMESMVSSVPPPIDINLKSLQKYKG